MFKINQDKLKQVFFKYLKFQFDYLASNNNIIYE